MERNQEEVRAFHLQNHQVKVTFQGFNSISDWVSGFPVSPMKINISEYYSEKINFVEQSTSKLNFCAPDKMTQLSALQALQLASLHVLTKRHKPSPLELSSFFHFPLLFFAEEKAIRYFYITD